MHDFSRVGIVSDEGVGADWALINFQIIVGGVEGGGVPFVVASLEYNNVASVVKSYGRNLTEIDLS